MLLDSNVIIDAAKPSGEWLARFVADAGACISIITRIEVLGYHLLTTEEERAISLYLGDLSELPVDHPVADRAIALRKQKKMGLADSILAATAQVHGLPLVTRNVADFKDVAGLSVIDPVAAKPQG